MMVPPVDGAPNAVTGAGAVGAIGSAVAALGAAAAAPGSSAASPLLCGAGPSEEVPAAEDVAPSDLAGVVAVVEPPMTVTPAESLGDEPEVPPPAVGPPVMVVTPPSDWLQPALPPSDTAPSSSKAPMIGRHAPPLRRARSFDPKSLISSPSINPLIARRPAR